MTDCNALLTRLYNQGKTLESAKAAVEAASRELGIAERAREDARRALDNADANTTIGYDRLGQTYDLAVKEAQRRENDVDSRVIESNAAKSQLDSLQSEYDNNCK